MKDAYNKLVKNESAFYKFNLSQKVFISLLIIIFSIGLFLDWHMTFFVLTVLAAVFYFIDLLFNLFIISRSYTHASEVTVEPKDVSNDSNLPLYTILCPLYKEWAVVPQFIKNMSLLDYPKDKLQILLLLEEDDNETLVEMQKIILPSYFEIVIVPDSQPKTKPKACNYGLNLARGEYITIYDAEDMPEPNQLKKVIGVFSKVAENIMCVQAKLNFYNPEQNILTRLFTAEYSLWFDLVLTGLQSINAPIPLGGTSNHFRTAQLRAFGGWDAYNVTEDADLGIRMSKYGFYTTIVDSTTYEEANSNTMNWFRQRTRWIKGYIQTYFVHMRPFKKKGQRLSFVNFLIFNLIIGGKVFSLFVNPFMWLITISYFTLRIFVGSFIDSFYPAPVLYIAIFSLVFGNFLYFYYYLIGCSKRGYEKIMKFIIFTPLYWVLMSVASWVAIYEFIVRPHFWYKTKHGLNITKLPIEDQYSFSVVEE